MFRALLVDDEEELVSTLQERLGFRGIEAEFVTKGKDAIHLLTQQEFDVLVLDIKMPGIGGLELAKIIKEKYPQMPILLITGHGSAGIGLEEIPDAAFECLPKPINIDVLIEKMKHAIGDK